MQHFLTPTCDQIEAFAWWDNAFTRDELDFLQRRAANASNRAVVGGPQGEVQENADVRRSNVDWMNKSQDTAWVFEKLAHVVSSLNAAHFRFDLLGFGEPIQLTNYEASEQGTYDWHQDFGTKVSRKLSLVLQLTDPAEYEGGNLEILTRNQPDAIQKRRGLITVFPSWTLHRVTPVTQGSRQSLVAWISGEPFK